MRSQRKKMRKIKERHHEKISWNVNCVWASEMQRASCIPEAARERERNQTSEKKKLVYFSCSLFLDGDHLRRAREQKKESDECTGLRVEHFFRVFFSSFPHIRRSNFLSRVSFAHLKRCFLHTRTHIAFICLPAFGFISALETSKWMVYSGVCMHASEWVAKMINRRLAVPK